APAGDHAAGGPRPGPRLLPDATHGRSPRPGPAGKIRVRPEMFSPLGERRRAGEPAGKAGTVLTRTEESGFVPGDSIHVPDDNVPERAAGRGPHAVSREGHAQDFAD